MEMRSPVTIPDIGAAHREALESYLDEMYRWNARINLTAVPSPHAWERHIGETAVLLAASSPPAGARVVDVGSGAGVPGIPLAVLRPDLEVALLESNQRRCAFLAHVSTLLRLANVIVINQRAEVTGRDPRWRQHFEVAVSRAAAPPPVLCELALPLLRVGGQLAALVSDVGRWARDCHQAAVACGGSQPEEGGPGVLIVHKVHDTPATYPRRTGVPGSRPLR